MKDPRLTLLAQKLVNYSIHTQPGENVLIENTGLESDFVCEIVDAVYEAGANPFVSIKDNRVQRRLVSGAKEKQLKFLAEYESLRMRHMDGYIGVRAGDNASELSDVPTDKFQLFQDTVNHPVHMQIRVAQTKWVVLRYPSPSMAQFAGMSTEAFEDFYFDVCTMDYARMGEAMRPLCALMEKTDRVRLTGKGTDITFSIQGMPAIPCAGECNIPDGEIFTAPARNSVNGRITYNAPSLHSGYSYSDISFRFENGRIVEATANDSERLNKVLDADAGARFIGEFAIGVNPYIHHPMKDTLFDEKIAGSIHFTPGQCYDTAPNGNDSSLHWDLVFIQTPEYGGGDIYFDDVLVRRDGLFVLPELEALNPENLK